jgi:predicted  nucleic acid-binding Zn-ribbon protein
MSTVNDQIEALQKEIALAERKKTGLENAIDSRKKTLARLQAQRCLEQRAARPAPSMSAHADRN